MTDGSWRRIAATPWTTGLDLIERCRSSHRRAVHAVERSRASAMAYGEPGPNAMVRERICVLVLRESSPAVAEMGGAGHAVRPPAIRRCQNC